MHNRAVIRIVCAGVLLSCVAYGDAPDLAVIQARLDRTTLELREHVARREAEAYLSDRAKSAELTKRCTELMEQRTLLGGAE